MLVIRVGVPMGISEGIHWTLYFMGAVGDQARFFAAQLIIIPLFAAVTALAYWLNKKAQKKHTENSLSTPSITNKGWLPKKPTLQTSQTPVDPKNSPVALWTARAFLIGAVAYALLLVVGDLAGLTDGIGRYIWPIALFGVTLAPVGAVPFLVKRREEQRRRKEACTH
jgi:hypothetical protein